MEGKLWKNIKYKLKPRQKDQELLNACYFGNIIGVKKWIAMGADVEYIEERDGWLPLHYAARWGDLKMMNLLIKAGANINGKTKSKETALHKCGRWDRKEAAIILLKLGADSTVKNNDGNRASDMTVDPELKFLLDNFEEYQEIIKNNNIIQKNNVNNQ
jgi:ankyrin repeat protein